MNSVAKWCALDLDWTRETRHCFPMENDKNWLPITIMTDGFCCLGHDLTDLYFLTKSNFYLFSFSLSIFLFFFFDFFEQFDSAALGAAPAAKQRVTSPSTSAVQKAERKLSSLSLQINNNHNNKENGKKNGKIARKMHQPVSSAESSWSSSAPQAPEEGPFVFGLPGQHTHSHSIYQLQARAWMTVNSRVLRFFP